MTRHKQPRFYVRSGLQKDVRSQDTVFVISGVTGSVEGRELTWQFVQDRWTDLHDRYKGGFLLARLIKVTVWLTFCVTG